MHRDKTVRLLVACCLANVLRLYAPDPPYDAEDLGRVFNLFVQQLKGLSEPLGTYYSYHFYLVESLATVKSIVLLWGVPEDEGRDVILVELFKVAFGLVHPTLDRTMQAYLVEVLDAVVGECPGGCTLPDECLALLLDSLAAGSPERLVGFSAELLALGQDRLATMLGRRFNEAVCSRKADVARAAHQQVPLLAKHCAGVLGPILSQVEQELLVDEPDVRTLAVQTLAAVFMAARAGRSFGSAWATWLGRRNDKLMGVRGHWIGSAVPMLLRLQDEQAREQLATCLGEKLLDPEERVREGVLLALSQVEQLEELPRALLEEVGKRCLDRKEEVRVAALAMLCALLRRLDTTDPLVLSNRPHQWAFLPNCLFQLLFTEDPDSRLLSEYYLEHSALAADDAAGGVVLQAARWAWMWAALGDAAKTGLTAWVRAKGQFVRLATAFVQLAEAGHADSRQMLVVLQHLAERFRAPTKAQAMLTQLAADAELLQLFRVLVDPNAPAAAVGAALLEIEGAPRAELPQFLVVYMARRCSWSSVSRSLFGALLGHQPAVGGLLELLMAELPVLGKNHGDLLLRAVAESGYEEAHLKAFSRFVAASAHVLAEDELGRLREFVRSGSRRQAKYAASILLDLTDLAVAMLEEAALDTAHPDRLVQVRAWQVLACVAAKKPALLPPYLEELLLEYEVLMADTDDSTPPGELELRSVSSKFWATVVPQVGSIGDKPWAAETLAILYKAVLSARNAPILPRLCTTAMLLVGRAATLSCFLERSPLLLAVLAGVDERLVAKAAHLVAASRAHPLFLAAALLALPKDPRARQLIQHGLHAWVSRNGRPEQDDGEEEHLVDSASLGLAEDLLVPLLVLLAASGLDEARCKQAITAFLDCILTPATVSYLYALAVEVKRYQPAPAAGAKLSPRRLYVCSELAQAVVRAKATWHHASLQAFPVPLRITDRALVPLEPGLAQRNLAKSYLGRSKAKLEHRKRKQALARPAARKPAGLAASAESTPRKNPGRSKRLPAGCLEALIQDDDNEDDGLDGLDDEDDSSDLGQSDVEDPELENESSGAPGNVLANPKRRQYRTAAPPAEFSLDL